MGERGHPQADWRTLAACLTVDPELFYGPDGESLTQARRRVRVAKRVCVTCPVQAECLASALAIRDQHGVWGGKTVQERARLGQRVA
jgi:WhiB family redox-sensing transcriptional regulator